MWRKLWKNVRSFFFNLTKVVQRIQDRIFSNNFAERRPTNLEEVLDSFRVVAAALATDAFDLLDLSRLTRRLNVLEVDVRVLAEVDDRAQEVEQTWKNTTEGWVELKTQCIIVHTRVMLYLCIKLRRTRDYLFPLFFRLILFIADKRIVNKMKLYIKINNLQQEFIWYLKKMLTFTFAKRRVQCTKIFTSNASLFAIYDSMHIRNSECFYSSLRFWQSRSTHGRHSMHW